MKTCKNGHENADDADLCSVCKIMLPGNKMGTRFGTTQPVPMPPDILESKAKAWVRDAGLDWNQLQQAEKDIIIRAQKASAQVGIVERALMIIGKYQAKPKASEKEEAEALVVEITAESVESLNRSLKLLERLSGTRAS